MNRSTISIPVSEKLGSISAELMEPTRLKAIITLAHGAGAGMQHRFMTALSEALAEHQIGTLRYNFLYMEHGKKRPDVPAVAHKAVEAALKKSYELFPAVPVVAAGKSFGGRMSSQYLSKDFPEFVKGIIFYGFPLHPAGEPSISRAEHLQHVKIPMLFLQGTRDALAEKELVTGVCAKLPLATLDFFEGADHSFKSGKKEFIPELASRTNQWIDRLLK
jgi:predicted alpha/beta-hydrolase family hydrolase